jgi:O-antigen/teichoic acid export membrane protein
MKALNLVVFNTAVLYIRLLTALIVSLFTIRFVLQALGETDYGIYSLVAGIISMLAVLQSSMSSASMRFMAHSQGTGDITRQYQTFNTTLLLHFFIGIILIIIMESGGFIMFEYFLNIPEGKIEAAKIVFHFMVISTFVAIIAVPYDAVINSHENLLFLSIVDLLGIFIKLGIAIYLTYQSGNLLIQYGFLLLITQVLMRVIKQVYSTRKYEECKVHFRKFVDKKILTEIISFSGWNLFGSLASMFVRQLRSVLLNIYFGVNVNAAEGISNKAGGQVNMIAVSMTRAINPQLVKSEGRGDRNMMLKITELATKYSVFLFALFAIPVIIEAPFLLNLWLTIVPEYAIIFIRLLLLGLFISKFSFEITSAIRAVGNIRNFQVAETIVLSLNIPIAYIFFELGFDAYSIYIVTIFLSIVVFFLRLYFGKKTAGLNISSFIRKGIIPVLAPILIASLLAILPIMFFDQSIGRLVLTFSMYLIAIIVLFRYIGIDKQEYQNVRSVINSGIRKIRKIIK